MDDQKKDKSNIIAYYDASVDDYHRQYERDAIYDISRGYPSNYFRLQLLTNSFLSKDIKRVIEVGVGSGIPLVTLGKSGIDVWGFDISKEMVKKAKEVMKEAGFDPDHIFWGDIEDSLTYAHAVKDGLFDGLIAMGVMPHINNDELVLRNIASVIRPGGSVFIEFRNKLFSLVTFNRFTHEFIINDLLENVSEEVKNRVSDELKSRLRMDMPPERKTKDKGVPGYDAITSRFHNPFEMIGLFEKCGFRDPRFLWYHYHSAMPYLERDMPELFRNTSVGLEHETSGWRGYFLCSAFVVEAVKA